MVLAVLLTMHLCGRLCPEHGTAAPQKFQYPSIKESFMSLTHEKIEARAYGLYIERSRNGGGQLEDWLKAEKEIEKGTAEHTEKRHLLKRNYKRTGKVPVLAGK